MQELRAARILLQKQDVELRLQADLLTLEAEITTSLKNLRNLDAAERKALNDALAAKDRVIASQEAAIAALKKNRWSWWKAAKTAAVGVAAGIVVGAIVLKN